LAAAINIVLTGIETESGNGQNWSRRWGRWICFKSQSKTAMVKIGVVIGVGGLAPNRWRI